MPRKDIYKSTMKMERYGGFTMVPSSLNPSKIPASLLAELNTGQAIGCAVEPQNAAHKAWVEVIATFDPNIAQIRRIPPDGKLTLVKKGDGNPVTGYIVRYYEVPLQDLQYIWDYDILATVFEETEVPSQQEMEDEVRRWISDFATLYVFPDAIPMLKPNI